MNISKEQYEMLCGWLSCVEMESNESALEWAKRGLAMRTDNSIVCIEIDRYEFEENCKKITQDFIKEILEKKND